MPERIPLAITWHSAQTLGSLVLHSNLVSQYYLLSLNCLKWPCFMNMYFLMCFPGVDNRYGFYLVTVLLTCSCRCLFWSAYPFNFLWSITELTFPLFCMTLVEEIKLLRGSNYTSELGYIVDPHLNLIQTC